MLLISFLQGVNMACHNHFRPMVDKLLTVDMFIKILSEEQDVENEETILGLYSECEISDAEDLDQLMFHRIRNWSCGCVLESSSTKWRCLLWWHRRWVFLYLWTWYRHHKETYPVSNPCRWVQQRQEDTWSSTHQIKARSPTLLTEAPHKLPPRWGMFECDTCLGLGVCSL